LHHVKANKKKPFNGEDVLAYFNLTPKQYGEICIVGDRLMTDILLGRWTGMYTIYCNPIDRKTDLWNVKPLRKIEDYILYSKFNIKLH